jgi:hypothetical protein
MTDRHSKPCTARNLVAKAAVFASAMLLGAPAFASSISDKSCPKSEQATLSVAVTQLNANTVSHDIALIPAVKTEAAHSVETVNETGLLAPRAEAAIREAFDENESPSTAAVDVDLIKTVLRAPMAGTESEADSGVTTDVSHEPQPEMKTQLPGVTDNDLSHFKKAMFRRDI